MPERRLPPHLAQWIVQTLARLTAVYAILQGLFIIIGGGDRWQSPAFATAMAVPGAPESWGAVICLAGSLALAGTFHPRPLMTSTGLGIIAVWSFFFTVSLLAVLIHNPTGATTGVFVYSYGAITATVLAVAYWRSRR